MLVKKLVAASLMTTVFSASAAEVTLEDMKAAFVKQQQEIEALKKQVKNTESMHEEAIQKYIKDEIAATTTPSLISLSPHVEGLKWTGDLRLRWEERNRQERGEKRVRIRQRLRLGFEWKTEEGFDIGVGIAADDGTNNARSTNSTFSNNKVNETGDLNLDLVYVKYDFENGFKVIGGAHKNPYLFSKFMWDSDSRPAGLTMQYNKDNLFVTGGAYQVLHGGDHKEAARLLAVQGGFKAAGFTAAAGFYHFNRNPDEIDDPALESDFEVAQIFTEYAGKTENFKYKLQAEYFVNVAAGGVSQEAGLDPKDNDTGIVLSSELSYSDWKFGYQYAYIEADSMVDDITDADYGTAANNNTDIEAHILKLGYKLTKNSSIAARYIMAEEIEGDDNGTLTQLDFKYKF